jgi:hypothetical protein
MSTKDLFLLCVLIANLVLHQTVERIHVGKKYGDIPRGIFVVRGENVVLLGEIVSETVKLLCVWVLMLAAAFQFTKLPTGSWQLGKLWLPEQHYRK